MSKVATFDMATKWIFFGNIMCSIGLLAISIGSTIRMARDGTLPTGWPVNASVDPTQREKIRAKEYFA